MTNEEKQAVLQFMGTVYGDAHKQDQMLIGQSGNLQPSSHVMKQRFEEVIRTPTEQQQYIAAQQQNAPAPAPVQEPAASPVVEVDVRQAAQELAAAQAQSAPPAAAPPAVTTKPDSSNQLEFDLSEPSKIDKLIDLIKEQNLLLKKISLKLDNGKGAKSTKKG
tara:strand:+ start:1413 stop:1901 length:489 start_codon:yes stop_codon:yes gene_type:complete